MGVPFVATSNAAAVVGLEAGGGDGANLDAASIGGCIHGVFPRPWGVL